MPELPDLEIFRENLLKVAINKVIKSVGCNSPKSLILGTLSDLKNVTKREKFSKVERRGKHLIFDLTNKSKLVLHLMLRGRVFYRDLVSGHSPSDCFWFEFSDGKELVINDPTKWAKLEILNEGDVSKSKLLSKLGPEADEIDLEEFTKVLKASRLGRIKPLLLDQKKIAGIGNAYADEILWKSKIHPDKTASLLSDKEVKDLHSNMKKVLNWGINENRNEVGEGFKESERKWMKVYRKKGKPCPECGSLIKHKKVVSRDTFYCEKCQRE